MPCVSDDRPRPSLRLSPYELLGVEGPGSSASRTGSKRTLTTGSVESVLLDDGAGFVTLLCREFKEVPENYRQRLQ